MEDVVRCSRSASSGKLVFPEIPAQSAVASLYSPASVPNAATLYSYTTIHPNPKSGLSPFSLGYADFGGELRVFGKLALAENEKCPLSSPSFRHAVGKKLLQGNRLG